MLVVTSVETLAISGNWVVMTSRVGVVVVITREWVVTSRVGVVTSGEWVVTSEGMVISAKVEVTSDRKKVTWTFWRNVYLEYFKVKT